MSDMKGMLTEDVQNRFATGISTYRASRIGKLRRGNIKLAYSKLIELAAKRLGISIKRRARLFWGQDMTVVYPGAISLAISRYGFFNEDLTNILLEYLKPDMTFLDVGAHIGNLTLLGSWLVGNSGQVHSFEPTPSTFEVLRSNAALRNNVYLNRVAVSSGPGTATLNDYGHAFSAYNSTYKAKMGEAVITRVKSTEFQAPVISLDEYVAQKGVTPNFVNIDARSAEFEILRGMEQILQRLRPTITIEFGDMDVEEVLSCRDVVLYLIDKGYNAYEFSEGGIVKHLPKERYDYDSILFLPET